jgi:hypothetical protein
MPSNCYVGDAGDVRDGGQSWAFLELQKMTLRPRPFIWKRTTLYKVLPIMESASSLLLPSATTDYCRFVIICKISMQILSHPSCRWVCRDRDQADSPTAKFFIDASQLQKRINIGSVCA